MANAPRERAPAPNREAADRAAPGERPAPESRRRGPAPAEQGTARRGPARGRREPGRGLGPTRKPPARGEAAPEAPEAAPGVDPRAARDPRMQKALGKLKQRAAAVKKHDPPAKKAAEAQAAAVPPANEKLAGAQAQQVDQMKQAEAKKPESDSFLTLLRAEIEKVMPQTLGETDSFMDEGDKQQLKGAATGNVNQQKEAATGELRSASEAPPDTSGIPGKEVEPLGGPGAAPATPSIGAAEAMPAPKGESEVSLKASKQKVDDQLAENKITPQQLRKANDPRFSAVLSAKQAVAEHADAAPGQYRAGEQKTLAQAAAKAVADEKGGLAGMRGQRNRANTSVGGKQRDAKAKDEARRKEVADTIEGIYAETKAAVEAKLNSLEADVTATFDRGIETALANMKSYVNQRKDAYKARRYDRIGGSLLWAKDKLLGLPDEVKVFYVEGRKLFLAELDRLIVSVAAMVDSRLKEAKAEVGKGQTRIKQYVDSLPRDLQAVGRAAEREMAGRFAELRSGIDERKNELAQKLAQRYKEASDKADEALKAMQAEDKGLVTAFVEKLGEIITILRNFKNRILSLLRKAASVIDLIVSDPIGFLGNLLRAVKQGFNQFKDRIWDHLRAGFIGWLVGSLGSAGIQVPRDLSLPSILQLVMQILGLTYDRIRAKAVKLIGERNVALLERAWQLISTLIRGGPAALWEQIKEYLSDLKQRVVDELQSWLITTIIKAAVTKLATMFNPVGAIIQAIITIYNTVMFFVERINQIMALVEAVVESVHSIATGAIGAAANWIEQAMARTIPVIISFLARLLGIGGISEKIRSIIQKVQAKVDSALDKLIDKIVKPLRGMLGRGGTPTASSGRTAPGALAVPEKSFKAGDESHKLHARTEGGRQRLVISSQTMRVAEFLASAEKNKNIPDDNKKQIKRAREIAERLDTAIGNVEAAKQRGEDTATRERLLLNLELNLAEILQSILANVPLSKFNEKYKLEGLIGTYGSMPKQIGDVLTPDHQPQAALLKYAASLPIFAGRRIQTVARGHAVGGVAINLHFKRHTAGRTYGSKGRATLAAAQAKIASKVSAIPGTQVQKQRQAVIDVLRDELSADSAAMKGVVAGAKTSPVFQDINDLKGLSRKDKETLIDAVKRQVTAAEDRIKAQNLDDLANT